MVLSVLLLLAAPAFADAAPKAPKRHSEETLRVMLAKVRQARALEVRRTVIGAAEELRDSVAAGDKKLANRLPGMARDPFDICRDLRGCPEAPQSLHVEDTALVDDAFVALARPWFKLQKARGKAVTVTVDPGAGVRLELEDLPQRPAVTLEAAPTPTGGFDVELAEGPEAARDYAAARAAVLKDDKK